MDPDSLYENEEQRKQHLRALQILIKEVGRPGEEITRLYYLVLQEYEKEAKVKTFLPILISKRVKEMIEDESQLPEEINNA
jgi:hypothetical protein